MAEETADIYRMNKLLEIENADWEMQLQQAVGFSYFMVLFPSRNVDLNFTLSTIH